MKQLSTGQGAIRARERRDKEREEQRYNNTLKEFVVYRYSHIVDEFNPFYEDLKARYPKKLVYINTNEFRLWRKNEIVKAFNSNGNEVAFFDSVDLAQGEQQLQREEQLHGEQQLQCEEQLHGEQQLQCEEQLHGEQQLQCEEQLHGEQQLQCEEQLHGEQQQLQCEEQLHGEQQQLRCEEQLHGEQQLQCEEQLHGEQQLQREEQLQGEQQQADNEVSNAIAEVEQIIRELENGGVPLQESNNDDEGIHLDLYEELQGDIEDMDYRLEVELENW